MRITITDTERGFLFRKGKFEKMLLPGSYSYFFTEMQVDVRKASLMQPLHTVFNAPQLALFRKDVEFISQTVTQDVPDGKIALHYADGRYVDCLLPGSYTYWNVAQKHTFVLYDLKTGDAPEELSEPICKKLCGQGVMTSFTVQKGQKGILRFNERFERMLEPGTYYFWHDGAGTVGVQYMETRKRLLNLTGQEILTKDKVGVRLNFVCSFQVTDCLKACTELENYEGQFYNAVQMTVRDYLAGLTLDELLTQRNSIQDKLLELIQPKAEALYTIVSDAGIKDIILPGDMRDIMNTVLLAEKRAQANVITRREEVASTRSLLNTAKLMDENKTLYKLKELEYLERICENVGNISVSGGDLLAHLRAIIGSEPDKK